MGLKSFFKKLTGETPTSIPSEEIPNDVDQQAEVENDLEDGFAITYGVELFFQSPPGELPKQAIMTVLKNLLPDAELVGSEGETETGTSSNTMMLIFNDHKIQYADGAIPSQIYVFASGSRQSSVADDPNYIPAFQQSWQFPDVRLRLAECRHSILVTDMMSAGLDYKERMYVFQRALYAIVQVLHPVAIYWSRSQVFHDTKTFLENEPDGLGFDELFGVLNVRLHRIDEPKGSPDVGVVMDTMGLAALGLPDLQIHCDGLDTEKLAGMLFGTGHYIFDHGDVIADGNTLSGWEASQRWVCQHELSLIPPKRIVVDIDAGVPYAAGIRNR